MTKRRNQFDPYSREQQRWPHRLHVRGSLGQTIHEQQFPGGSDLRARFELELARWAAEGWTLETPFKAMCFINRGAERHVVTLTREVDYAGPPIDVP